MFGYIVVNKAELKFREFDVYHSYYCGLCRELKERYGRPGQLSLSYDMTFLLMLLSSLYEPETEQGEERCIAHPLEKHCYCKNQITEYIAQMNVLLTCYKCRDDWKDEHKVARLMYGKLLAGKSRKAERQHSYPYRYREKAEKIALLMQDFYEAEAEAADIDTVSGLFGRIMAEIVLYKEDEWSESLRRFGFYLGKFIYLMDAYEDVEEDIRKGNFNPFRERYQRLDFEEECRTILTLILSECCKEFEQLPILENVEILRNILYSGVWCRFEMVRKKREKRE